MSETITINGKEYPAPHIDRMKRKQAKKLKPLLGKLQGEDLEALWDVVALMIPSLTPSALDDLDLGECKAIISRAGVAKFDDVQPDGDEITVGESGASTSS